MLNGFRGISRSSREKVRFRKWMVIWLPAATLAAGRTGRPSTCTSCLSHRIFHRPALHQAQVFENQVNSHLSLSFSPPRRLQGSRYRTQSIRFSLRTIGPSRGPSSVHPAVLERCARRGPRLTPPAMGYLILDVSKRRPGPSVNRQEVQAGGARGGDEPLCREARLSKADQEERGKFLRKAPAWVRKLSWGQASREQCR